MKNTILIFSFLLMVATSFWAIETIKAKTPKKYTATEQKVAIAAKKFVDCFEQMNFECARSVSSKETIKILNMMEEISKKMVSDSIRMAHANDSSIIIAVRISKSDSTKAVVDFKTNRSSVKKNVSMMIENGSWVAAMNKQELIDEDAPERKRLVPAQNGKKRK